MVRSTSPCAPAAAAVSRAWLASGIIPGTNPAQRSMATRALLDLRLLTRPDGAVLASWHPGWADTWPRDSSWAAAALAATGHAAEALGVLEFLRRMQSRDGTWAARYWPDGPVRSGTAGLPSWTPSAGCPGRPGPGTPRRGPATRLPWPGSGL